MQCCVNLLAQSVLETHCKSILEINQICICSCMQQANPVTHICASFRMAWNQPDHHLYSSMCAMLLLLLSATKHCQLRLCLSLTQRPLQACAQGCCSAAQYCSTQQARTCTGAPTFCTPPAVSTDLSQSCSCQVSTTLLSCFCSKKLLS